MQISLYKNSSDPRKLSKTLSDQITINVALKDDTDVLSPIIILQASQLPPQYNYCRIPIFNRYYFLTNNRVLVGKELEIQCQVDVLMSWKVPVLNAEIIASRTGDTTKTNAYLPDEIPLQVNRNVIYKKFLNASEAFGSDKITKETPSYLLTVTAGGSDNIGTPAISLVSTDSTAHRDVLKLTNADYATKFDLQIAFETAPDSWQNCQLSRRTATSTTNDWYYDAVQDAYIITVDTLGYGVGKHYYRSIIIWTDGTVDRTSPWSNTLGPIPAN